MFPLALIEWLSFGDHIMIFYANKTILGGNAQNNQLVDYLKANLPYINKSIDYGSIKITYHRGKILRCLRQIESDNKNMSLKYYSWLFCIVH